MTVRTDLAAEARALFEKNADETTRLEGVCARRRELRGAALERVEILDERGERALGKPRGRYETVEFDPLTYDVPHLSALLARRLRLMLGVDRNAPVLLVGLGNRAVTPDALGPETVGRVFLTRHLLEHLPEQFSGCRPVSAICPGVLATTGMESAELVRGAVAYARPECVIAVDALAAAAPERLCRTVQLSDTGISPGSGVGNHRAALTRQTLGVPVYAIGIPTVASSGVFGGAGDMILTPRDIDAQIRQSAHLLAAALNRVLHPQISDSELTRFLPIS